MYLISNIMCMEIKDIINVNLAKRESNKLLLESRKQRKRELVEELETINKSQVLLQTVAQETQSLLSSKIDNIVNLGLATCFPEYKFNLEYVPARGKTEVKFTFKDVQGNEVDIMNQNGGGVVDLVSFCLRVAVYSISDTSNTIVLDEPFRFVSRSLRERVAELLHTLSEKLNLQIIEVTHINELVEGSDSQITIKKVNGVSNVY